MAALESVSGEAAMADLNPSLDGESWAATDCSEFQLNATSLRRRGQLWILERQPHSAEILDDGGLETNQLTTAEKVALEDSARAVAVWKYQWQPAKVVMNLSVPWQNKIISVRDEEVISQSLKQINYYSNQTKNLYFCDRHKKDFQWPSSLAQHKNLFYANKVPKQSEQLIWEQLEMYNSLVSDQSSQTKNCLIGDACGENIQSPSHLSQYYNIVLPNENSAWQYQKPESEASSLTSEACNGSLLVPVPLQAENIIGYVGEAVSLSAIQMTDQRIETKNLHICDQCGKECQWLSELVQHQLVHFGGKADRQEPFLLGGRNPSRLVPVPILLQENNPCTSSWETFQQMSRHHNTHAKIQRLYLCHHSGKDFCRSSALALHNWYIFFKRELAGQSQSKVNKSSPLLLVPQMTENMFADSCETSNLISMLMSLYTRKQHIYDQWGRCFHCLCALAQQQLEHLELKADRDELFHLGAYIPKNSVPIPLQAQTISENSKIFMEERTYAKNLYICNCDRKDFQCHCLLARHHPHVPLGEEADTQDQFKAGASSLSQLQMEIKVIGSSETLKLQSNQTTTQVSHVKSLGMCEECGKDFRWPSALARHQVVHSGKAREEHHPSQMNGSSETHKPQSLQTTDSGSHIKSLGMCEECGKDFRWPSALARHQVVHSGKAGGKQCPSKKDGQNGLLPGLICGLMEGDHPSNLMTNQWTEKNKYYTCGCCGKSFQWPSDLARHKHTHSRKLMRGKCTKLNKYSTCDHCGKSFQWPSHLAQHEHTHSRRKLGRGKCAKLNKSYICDQCGKSFWWPSDLARHERTHSRRELVRGKCTKLNTYCTCGHCGKSFQCPSDLARHKHTHSRKKLMRDKYTKLNKSYICDQCGKSFWWPSDLARHELTHSKSKLESSKCAKLNKSYICDQCGKNFQWPDLARHECAHPRKKLMRGKHAKLNKSCICDQCGKGFQWPSNLARHESTHFREMLHRDKCMKLQILYVCTQCGENFQGLSPLAQHKCIHPRGIITRSKCTKLKKPHICGECGKSFRWPSDLARHEPIHSKYC